MNGTRRSSTKPPRRGRPGRVGGHERQDAVGLAAESQRRQRPAAADMVDPVVADGVEGRAVEALVAVRAAAGREVLDRVPPRRRPQRGVEGAGAGLLTVAAVRERRQQRRIDPERRRRDRRVGTPVERRGAREAGRPERRPAAPARARGLGVVGRRALRDELGAVGEAMRADEVLDPRGARQPVELLAHAVDGEGAHRSAGQRQRHRHRHPDALGFGVVGEPPQRRVDRRQVRRVLPVNLERAEMRLVGEANRQLVGDRAAVYRRRRGAVLLDPHVEAVRERARDGGRHPARRRVRERRRAAGPLIEVRRPQRVGDPRRPPAARRSQQRRPRLQRVAAHPDGLPVRHAGNALSVAHAFVEGLDVNGVREDAHAQRGLVGGRAHLDAHRQQDERDIALELDIVAEQLLESDVQLADLCRPLPARGDKLGDGRRGGLLRLLVAGRPRGGQPRPLRREFVIQVGAPVRELLASCLRLRRCLPQELEIGHQRSAPATIRLPRNAARAGSWKSR